MDVFYLKKKKQNTHVVLGYMKEDQEEEPAVIEEALWISYCAG